jgi:hypothetical protein
MKTYAIEALISLSFIFLYGARRLPQRVLKISRRIAGIRRSRQLTDC